MELVVVPEKTRLHSGPKRRLQQKFEQGGRRRRRSRGLALLSDDHRGRRFQRDPLSTVKSSQHLVARRPRRQTFEFSQEVVGERLSCVCRSDLQLAVQRLWHIPDLNHL